MASVLSSLGLTTAPPPPASEYIDQKAEVVNLADAKAQLASTTSSINLALSTAKLVGVDPSYTKTLDALNEEASNIQVSNLTSAQLAAKGESLNKKLEVAQATQDSIRKQQVIDDFTAVAADINRMLRAVKADKTVPAENIKQYEELDKTAKEALAAIKGPPPPKGSEAPKYPTSDELRSSLDDLNTALEAAQNKVFNWERFWKNVFKKLMYFMTFVAVVWGALLGGIIMSNAYAEDHFWGIKVFYFIYGAVFFPFSLVYGAVKTPFWVSTFIPIISSVPYDPAKDLPKAAAPTAPAAPAAPANNLNSLLSGNILDRLKDIPKVTLGGGESKYDQEGGFTMPSLSGLLSKAKGAASSIATKAKGATSTLVDKAKGAASSIATKAKGAASTLLDKAKGAASSIINKPKPPVAGPAQTAPPLTIPTQPPPPKPTGGFFSYTPVNHSNPTEAEISSRTRLKVMSITNLIVLVISAVYYGVDILVLKNRV